MWTKPNTDDPHLLLLPLLPLVSFGQSEQERHYLINVTETLLILDAQHTVI